MNEKLNTHQAFESTMSAGSLSSLIDLHRSEEKCKFKNYNFYIYNNKLKN